MPRNPFQQMSRGSFQRSILTRRHKVKKYLVLVLAVVMTVPAVIPAGAQDMPDQQITVNDQLSLNSRVDIASVYSAQQGFVVIHTDGGSGAAIGQAPVAAGW